VFSLLSLAVVVSVLVLVIGVDEVELFEVIGEGESKGVHFSSFLSSVIKWKPNK